jgi:uncharacterized protein YdiU (UPF0061 family)
MMADKLGLADLSQESDRKLIMELEDLFALTPTDMTIFYRRLADIPLAPESGQERLEAVREAYYEPSLAAAHEAAIVDWLDRYAASCRASARADAERRRIMNENNPKYVLRNYLSQKAIDAADQGDFSLIERLLRVMKKPYDEQPDEAELAAKRPAWAENKPGCSALSCSS